VPISQKPAQYLFIPTRNTNTDIKTTITELSKGFSSIIFFFFKDSLLHSYQHAAQLHMGRAPSCIPALAQIHLTKVVKIVTSELTKEENNLNI